ncbi:MAG: shikimate kinase [Candidatus Sulfotelmatobacter sp.]
MGAGKSSVGRALASQLNWSFEDLDQRIERRNDRTVAEIFREFGEAEFRRMEHEALEELLDELTSGAEKVIALGGGAFIHESNVKLIEAKKIPSVFLDAAIDELWRRCIEQQPELGIERPLLTGVDGFRELYERRHPYYLRASSRQETGGKAIEQIATELVQTLGLSRRGGNRGQN